MTNNENEHGLCASVKPGGSISICFSDKNLIVIRKKEMHCNNLVRVSVSVSVNIINANKYIQFLCNKVNKVSNILLKVMSCREWGSNPRILR